MRARKPVVTEPREVSSALPADRYRDPAIVAERDELAEIRRRARRMIENGDIDGARRLAAQAQIRMPKVKERGANTRAAAEAVFVATSQREEIE